MGWVETYWGNNGGNFCIKVFFDPGFDFARPFAPPNKAYLLLGEFRQQNIIENLILAINLFVYYFSDAR